MQTILKANEDYETKSENFDYVWIFLEVKLIVSGLDTKTNPRVSMHNTMTNYFLFKQHPYESNNSYLARFKLMVETLKIAFGDYILVSKTMLKLDIDKATKQEIDAERENVLQSLLFLEALMTDTKN